MGKKTDKEKEKEYTYADYEKTHDDSIETDERKHLARWIITFLIELILVVGLVAAIIVVKARNKWGLADITDLSEQDLMINSGANKRLWTRNSNRKKANLCHTKNTSFQSNGRNAVLNVRT